MEFTVGMSNRIRNELFQNELFQTKYPEFEIVDSRVRVKNGTSSISITDAFFMMALHGFSIDDTLREVKEAETLIRSILHG